jgi:hypothetical protein
MLKVRDGSLTEDFDSPSVGAAPVCLGDSMLKQVIPRDCVLFRDSYSSNRALLKDLLRWDDLKWAAYKKAGQKFLYSDRIKPFFPKAYAQGELVCLKGGVA